MLSAGEPARPDALADVGWPPPTKGGSSRDTPRHALLIGFMLPMLGIPMPPDIPDMEAKPAPRLRGPPMALLPAAPPLLAAAAAAAAGAGGAVPPPTCCENAWI